MRAAALASALLLALLSAQEGWSLPLDDTFRNGRLDRLDSVHFKSYVHEALNSKQPGIREQADFLGIDQVILAPTYTSPPRVPQCISARRVSRALAAAINAKYAGQLQHNATIDTTYTQVFDSCRYSSFVSVWAPDEVRSELVAAANANELCALLPSYCEALNLTAGGVTQPGGDAYVLQSSSGDAAPELPPVLEFKCKQYNFTQVMDHFAKPAAQQGSGGGGSGEQAGGAGKEAAPPASRRRLQEEEEEEQEGQPGAASQVGPTFNQTYWVCDDAWPGSRKKQRESGHVIVFLGNEGPLGVPQQPIVFENARRLNALVILIEHRYYGDSTPYPEPQHERVPTADYKWLQIAQVIEDSATVVQHVRKERDVPAAVPAVVIGGSYGGMIASYHRVVRPDVFAAAVAASAPVTYIVGTKMWARTANRYHQFIEDSANTMSGSPACSGIIRDGLEELLALGKTEAGRQQLFDTFQMCGSHASSVLPNDEAVLQLQNNVIGSYQGFAQVNNQPPMLGEMALACQVLANATASGGSALQAVAAVEAYFSRNGSADWCYRFRFTPGEELLPDVPTGFNSYTYQCCTEGTVYSSLLPAYGGTDTTLNPEDIPVPISAIDKDCRHIFGADLPRMRDPPFARHIMRELDKLGAVVFTNGGLDGWSGGSLGISPNTGAAPSDPPKHGGGAGGAGASAAAAAAAAGALSARHGGGGGRAAAAARDDAGWHGLVDAGGLLARLQGAAPAAGEEGGAGGAAAPDAAGGGSGSGSSNRKRHPHHHGRLAYVIYDTASHCTDTHTYAWKTPGEPPQRKRQRARAMDYAAAFAQQHRQALSAPDAGGDDADDSASQRDPAAASAMRTDV